VGACRSVPCAGESDSTRCARTREPDEHVVHLVNHDHMTLPSSTNLIVCLLVAGGFREVEAKENDEDVDVRYRHEMHVAELRSRDVDGGDVVGSSSRGVILEIEARSETTGKELVRNRSTCDWVHEENFRPRRSVTVWRVYLDFCKHFVERCESLGLFLEEFPKPVLEHGVRGFAVAGNPRFAHGTM
jgi:hypothetical protein